MGRLDETLDMNPKSAIRVPSGVVVVASDMALATLSPLADDLVTVSASAGAMPPRDYLATATMIILEVDPADRLSMERLDAVRNQFPGTPVVAAVRALDVSASRALMRRGVADLVELPFRIDELLTSMADVHRSMLQKAATPSNLAPLLVLTKSAGGAGSTTVATHLAAALATARADNARACIIDCDLQSGDVAAYLGCSPRLTLIDLLEADERLDEELLRSVVCTGDASVDVVAAPSDIQPIEALDFDRLMAVVTLARRQYDVVLVDLPANLTNWAVSVIFAATRVIQVTTTSLPSLRHAKRQLQFFQSMGLERDRIDIVVNRVEQRMFKMIGSEDVGDTLGMPVAGEIVAESGPIQSAQDEGSLVGRGKFAKQMRELADTIAAHIERGD